MSPISPAVQQVIQARQDVTRNEIDIALMGKQLDARKATGQAINQMIQSIADAQKQLAKGQLDIRM